MRSLLLGLLFAVAPAGPAQADWGELAARDSPGGAVATCLRAAGAPGLVGLLGPRQGREFPYDVLRMAPDGIESAARVRLGQLADCPAPAVDPSGAAVVAAPVQVRGGLLVRAALAEPGGGFGAAVTLARSRLQVEGLVAAVSPRGDAVVAWALHRYPSRAHPRGDQTRLFAALRPAGGSFGRPRPLTPWRRLTFDFAQDRLAAAMDARGTATLAWKHDLGKVGRYPDMSTVAVATAPPGGPLGRAQTLTRRVQDADTLTLAVAPNGAALLAHDGQEAIWRFERQAGAAEFERLRPLHSRRAEWAAPAAAVGPDGAALLAWRAFDPDFVDNPGLLMSARRAGGEFGEPRVVRAGERPSDTFGGGFYAIIVRRGVFVPDDSDNTDLRATLAPGGRYLLAWGGERSTPFGDDPTGVWVATGAIGARGPVRLLGCPCRDANGVAGLQLASGEPAVAFSDNLTYWLGSGDELAQRAGRVHLAGAGASGAPPPPAIKVQRPRPRTLAYTKGLPIRVRCSGACDVRAYVVGERGRARGVGTGHLARAGRLRVGVEPGLERHLAPPGGDRARLVVRAWAPAGRRYSEAGARLELRRAPLRELPSILSASAVRSGGSIAVSWRTSRPTRDFIRLEALDADRHPVEGDIVAGDGRRSFHRRLRVGKQAGEVRWVSLSVIRGGPPHDHTKRVLVPVTG